MSNTIVLVPSTRVFSLYAVLFVFLLLHTFFMRFFLWSDLILRMFSSITYYLPTPFPAQWLYNKLWFVLFLPFTRCCTPSSSLSLQKARTLRFIQPPIFSSHQNIQSMAMAESNDVFRKHAAADKLDGINYPL